MEKESGGILVLTRRISERLIVSGKMLERNIEFFVLGISGNQVKIGVRAPKNIHVDREEIYRNKVRDGIYDKNAS